jgi:hypothetical protein
MSLAVNKLGIHIGTYQLIRDEIVRCPLRWTDTRKPGASCLFSVQFNSYVGETRGAREVRAMAEARRLAQAFLDATAPYESRNDQVAA